MPIGMRITSGTRPWPPNMKRFFAAWLTISSMRAQREVDHAHLDHRPQAGERHADAGADDGGLADRRVDHALGAEALLQALVLPEDAAAAEVFAEHDDARVGLHLARTASAAASA